MKNGLNFTIHGESFYVESPEGVREILLKYSINNDYIETWQYEFDRYVVADALGRYGDMALLEEQLPTMCSQAACVVAMRTGHIDVIDRIVKYYGEDIFFERVPGRLQLIVELVEHRKVFHERFLEMIKSKRFVQRLNDELDIKKYDDDYYPDFYAFLSSKSNDHAMHIDTMNALLDADYPVSEYALVLLSYYSYNFKGELRPKCEALISKMADTFDSFSDVPWYRGETQSLMAIRTDSFGEKIGFLDEQLLKKANKSAPEFFKAALKNANIVLAAQMVSCGFTFRVEDFCALNGYETESTDYIADTASMRVLLDAGCNPKTATKFLSRYLHTFQCDIMNYEHGDFFKKDSRKKMEYARTYIEMGFGICDGFFESIRKCTALSDAERSAFIAELLLAVPDTAYRTILEDALRNDEIDAVAFLLDSMEKAASDLNEPLEHHRAFVSRARSAATVELLAAYHVPDVSKEGALKSVNNPDAVVALLKHGYTKGAESAFSEALRDYSYKPEKAIALYDFDNSVAEGKTELIKPKKEVRNHILKPERKTDIPAAFEAITEVYDIKTEPLERGYTVNFRIVVDGHNLPVVHPLNLAEEKFRNDYYFAKCNFYVEPRGLIEFIVEKLGGNEVKAACKTFMEKVDREKRLAESFKKAHSIVYSDGCSSMSEDKFWRDLKAAGYDIKQYFKTGNETNIDVGGGEYAHFYSGRADIDDFFIEVLITNGKRKESAVRDTIKGWYDFLRIIDKVAEDATKKCWECGRTFSFWETNTDRTLPAWEAFNQRIDHWNDSYCGCDHG